MAPIISILDLAGETIISIFMDLSCQDIVRCKQVCKRFKHEIDESIALQYKIECEVCGVLDGDANAFSVTERLQRLRDQQEAWASGEPTEVLHVKGPYSTFGTVMAGYVLEEDGRWMLHVIQLPSRYRNIPKKEWYLDLPFSALAFAIDQSQRLLIAAENLELTIGVPRLRFHILDSETGQAHPLAASAFLDAEGTTCIGMNILGDVFGVVCERTINGVIAGSVLQVWNWKTSHLLLNLAVVINTTFIIIEGPYVLLPSRPSDTDLSTLCVLPCNSDEKIDVAEINRTAILELGLPINDPSDVVDISLDTPQLPPHDAVVPFFGDPERRLIHINASLFHWAADGLRGPVQVKDCFVPLYNVQTLLRSQEQHPALLTASQAHTVYPWPHWSQMAVTSDSWDPGEDGLRITNIRDHRAPRVFIDRSSWTPPDTPGDSYRTMFNFNAYWAKRWNSHVLAQFKAAGAGYESHRATTSIGSGRFGDTVSSRHDWVVNVRPEFYRQVLLDDGVFGMETLQRNDQQQTGRYTVWTF